MTLLDLARLAAFALTVFVAALTAARIPWDKET